MNTICKLAALTVVSISFSLGANAGDRAEGAQSMHNHQQAMQQTMKQMDSLMMQMHESDDMKMHHQKMQQHSQAMHEGFTQMKDMMSAKRQANEQCLAEETSDNQTCYQVESHADTQMNMMIKMMEHMMERQAMIQSDMHQKTMNMKREQ